MSTVEDVSDTALWVATYRALESERPDALFRDPLASVLAGERGRQIAKELSHSKIMSWIMVARTVAIDRLISNAVQGGVDTVINLGAGLDTRPYRMTLPKELRWIEVDFPKMISMKNEKLKDEKPVCRLERIALDLSKDEERRALFAKLGSETRNALVLTEGVIPYLANEEAAALAKDLAAVPSFRYWVQDYHNHGSRRRLPRRFKERLKAAPFRFNVPDWFAFFAQYGWGPVERVTVSDEAKRIGRPLPFVFPLSLIFLFIPKKKKQKLRDASGYVLMGRK